jgi:hypothetical protein
MQNERRGEMLDLENCRTEASMVFYLSLHICVDKNGKQSFWARNAYETKISFFSFLLFLVCKAAG